MQHSYLAKETYYIIIIIIIIIIVLTTTIKTYFWICHLTAVEAILGAAHGL